MKPVSVNQIESYLERITPLLASWLIYNSFKGRMSEGPINQCNEQNEDEEVFRKKVHPQSSETGFVFKS